MINKVKSIIKNITAEEVAFAFMFFMIASMPIAGQLTYYQHTMFMLIK